MASSRAQQAAIAISMKKAGKKPKMQKGGSSGNVLISKSGTISRFKPAESYMGANTFSREKLDTAGYSKGKQNFKLTKDLIYKNTPGVTTQLTKKPLSSTTVSRKDVPKTIQQLKQGADKTNTSVVGVATKALKTGVAAAAKAAAKPKKAKGGTVKMKTGGSTPAWTRKEGKNPTGGLNAKGVASYRAANPGSKLQTAVTTKPSKLKPGSKDAKRRKSFCARSAGQMANFPKAAKDPNSRLRLARKKWNC